MGLLRDSIFRIEIVDPATRQIKSVGTGFLVGPDLVLTAYHVVADRTKDSLTLKPGYIRVRFGGEETSPTSKASLQRPWFRSNDDWALLRLKNPPPNGVALPLSRLGEEGDAKSWRTRGFPPGLKIDGITFRGYVQAVDDERVDGAEVIQLYSENAAAGDGSPVQGLSGAPVMVDRCVVGLLRWAILRKDEEPDGAASSRAQAGVLFACPILPSIDG